MVAGFRFPQDRLAFVYTLPGSPILMPGSIPLSIYLNQAATLLAPIRTLSGVLIPGSVVTTGPDGLVEEFLGPDAVDEGSRLTRLWSKAPVGAVYMMEAQYYQWIVTGTTGAPGTNGTDGAPGPPGPMGTDYYAVYNFASPSDTWVMVHNQNTYGIDVEAVDNNNVPVEGTVSRPNLNTIQIDWYYPMTGEARVYT